jgi:hypothetical protein
LLLAKRHQFLYHLDMDERMKTLEGIGDLYLKTLQEGFAFREHVLPKGLLTALQEKAAKLKERKTTIEGDRISQDPAFSIVKDILTKKLPNGMVIMPNTLIIKHYTEGDGSGAYEFHRDPEEYTGIFSLISLTGKATLEVQTEEGKTITINCAPNTLVTMLANNNGRFQNENLVHRVSPPASGQVRDIIFLGMRTHAVEK